MNVQFRNDVDIGLSAEPKHLSSMYFYDKKGDELFMQIMALPEYYLTRAELEIFSVQTLAMIKALNVEKGTYFELIELGAGDGSKTKYLLKALLALGFDFSYLPIDISQWNRLILQWGGESENIIPRNNSAVNRRVEVGVAKPGDAEMGRPSGPDAGVGTFKGNKTGY